MSTETAIAALLSWPSVEALLADALLGKAVRGLARNTYLEHEDDGSWVYMNPDGLFYQSMEGPEAAMKEESLMLVRRRVP